MIETTKLASNQLSRMRGMNRFYHERFFSDVRFTTTAVVVLFALGAAQTELAYLLIPPIAVLGAAQTAFDASYLIFSRHYAAALERYLNSIVGEKVLVAHEMEDRYLFPLHTPKLVTAAGGRDFSWFGFMTLFYTAMGLAAFGFGLALGWTALFGHGDLWAVSYLGALGSLGGAALVVGWWWFPGGAGEKRLSTVLSGLGAPITAPDQNT
jgi:hypothetical protein